MRVEVRSKNSSVSYQPVQPAASGSDVIDGERMPVSG